MHRKVLICCVFCSPVLLHAAAHAAVPAQPGTLLSQITPPLPAQTEALPEPDELRQEVAEPQDVRQALPAEPALTPAQAARQVQKRYGGRVLAVQRDGIGYRVKVLNNGEVRIYVVSP